MIKNRKYFSLMTLEDFKRHAQPDLTYTTKNADSLTYGEYMYHTDRQSVQVRNGSSSGGGFFSIDIGQLFSGDIVHISAETRWLAANVVRFAIDRFYNPEFTGSKQTVYQTGTDTPDTSEFLQKVLTYVIRNDGYYRVSIGTWTNNISMYELRKAKVLVYTDAN